MTHRLLTGTVLLAFVASVSVPSTVSRAQSTGASVKIQHGKVVASRGVKIESGGSAAGGAVVGGTIGLIVGGSTKKKRRRRVATGAAIGAAAASSSKQVQQAMEYTVQTGGGAMIKVVTDQTEIRNGDCVVVEESGGRANVRRASSTMCEPESQSVVTELRGELQEEAAECIAAKKELVAAKTEEALNLALRKTSILCDN